jgi:hypothetical protein
MNTYKRHRFPPGIISYATTLSSGLMADLQGVVIE